MIMKVRKFTPLKYTIFRPSFPPDLVTEHDGTNRNPRRSPSCLPTSTHRCNIFYHQRSPCAYYESLNSISSSTTRTPLVSVPPKNVPMDTNTSVHTVNNNCTFLLYCLGEFFYTSSVCSRPNQGGTSGSGAVLRSMHKTSNPVSLDATTLTSIPGSTPASWPVYTKYWRLT